MAGLSIPKLEEEKYAKKYSEFEKYYDKEMNDVVKEVNKNRIKLVFRGIRDTVIAIALIYLFFKYNYLLPMIEYAYIGFVILLITLFIIRRKYRKAKERFINQSKSSIIEKLLQFMLPDGFSYDPEMHISRSFLNSNIFEREANEITGDDYFYGNIGSTSITFSELNAVERVSNQHTKKRYKIFKGLFYVVDFNKDFDGFLRVVPGREKSKFKRGFKNLLSKSPFSRFSHLETVELENPTFMDTFDVRTNDQIMARYILTPAFMERLLAFSTKNRKYKTHFSFYHGTMYLALATERQHFTFSMFTMLTKKKVGEYFQDINIALELVDELNLNLRIWSKE